MVVRKNSGMAVASFVLGLCSVPLGWVPFFGQILSILAIVFGFVGLSNLKYNKNMYGKPLAIWGIVLGFLWLFIFVLLIIIGVGWGITNNLVGE